MWIDIGYASLLLALLLCTYSALVPWLALRYKNQNLLLSSFRSSHGVTLLCILASAVLVAAFLTDSYEVVFVWQNSNRDLPDVYKFTAYWGGMDGSLLLWQSLLAIFTSIAIVTDRKLPIIPYVISILSLVQLFILAMLVTWSNPFQMQFPAPLDGRGLNALLQHPAMVSHPPFLYLGYVSTTIPFAYAMGVLLIKRFDNFWLFTTRRWIIFSWYFLSIGQILGGYWAYEELGWGGYWGWDPVENSSIMPWLAVTALLHSVILQEKLHMMKVWNFCLIILAFSLSILGTFIVRSGVLNSVHAFAQSEVGPAFLVFTGIILLGAFTILFSRLSKIKSRHTSDELLSKETTFLLNNLILLGILATIFLGTIFPLFIEAVQGVKISIQAPFFNTLVVPMGVALMLLLGLCTLFVWRKTTLQTVLHQTLLPLIIAAIATAGIGYFISWNFWAMLVLGITIFTTINVVRDYWKTVSHRQKQGTSYLQAFINTARANYQRLGGMLVHLGFIIMFTGFVGNFLTLEKRVHMNPGDLVSLGKYTMRFDGLGSVQYANHSLETANLSIVSHDNYQLQPGVSFYKTQAESLTEVAIYRNLWEDLYVVLTSQNSDGSVNLRIQINPLIGWVWFGVPFITAGVLVSWFYRPQRHKPASDAL